MILDVLGDVKVSDGNPRASGDDPQEVLYSGGLTG